MLCQNCQKNDATTHLKRIINGEAAEIHLCAECAARLGVADVFPGIGSPFAGILGGMFASPDIRHVSSKVLRCDTCSFSFEDIARTGRPGCPDCYRVFGEKLRPALQKLHGRAVHVGKIPKAAGDDIKREHKIELLKEKLNQAIDEQNFERAAQLRDEIRTLMKEQGTEK